MEELIYKIAQNFFIKESSIDRIQVIIDQKSDIIILQNQIGSVNIQFSRYIITNDLLIAEFVTFV